MVTKLTVEFDDQYSDDFQRMIRAFEEGERGAVDLAAGTNQSSDALTIMRDQQLQTVAAIDRNTMAVHENRDSWIEVTNTLVEFGRNVRDAAVWVKDTTTKLVDHAVTIGVVESRAKAASVATQTLASRMLGIAKPVFAAKLAYEGFQAVLRATGEDIEAAADNATMETRRMIGEIKAGLITLEELQQQTGKSAEELGIRVTSNWTTISDAAGKADDSFGKAFASNRAAAAEAFAQVTGLSTAWGFFEDRLTQSSDIIGVGLDKLGEKFREVEAHSRGLTKAQLAQREEAQRMLPILAEIEAHEAALRRQLRVEKELGEIREQTSLKSVQARLEAERRERDEMAKTAVWSERLQAEYMSRIEALSRREIELVRETEQRQREALQKSYEQRAELRRQEGEAVREQLRQEHEARKEALDKQRALEEAHAQGKEALALQERIHAIERVQDRLRQAGDREKEILALEKTIAVERAQFQASQTDDEVERIKIAYELKKQLRELDQNHHREMETKKTEASRQAAERQAQLQRELVQKFQGQRDEAGRNPYEQMLAGQSRKKIAEQVFKDRLAREQQERGDLGLRSQHRLEQNVRRGVARDFQSGNVDKGEVARAQQELASQQIRAMRSSGQLNKSQARAMEELARLASDLNQSQDAQAERLQQIEEWARGQSQAVRGSQQRQRAQRRG